MNGRSTTCYVLFTLFNYLTSVSTLSYSLNDGHTIPAVALGTSLGHLADGTRVLPVNHSLAHAVEWALEAGYKHIDTAALYRVEDEVGLGVQDYIRANSANRSDVYVTTKLWNDAHERDDVIPALRKSLKELRLDKVDLYLMHYPMAYTVNPTITNDELINWCQERGVIVMAYTPFGAILGRKSDAPPPRADHPVLLRLAAKYKKTVPQILLRYLLERKLVAIPRSTNKERIKENINILDFSLTSNEVEELSRFNNNYRLRTPAKWYAHPHFPFEKKNLTAQEIEYIIAHSKDD
ncbi:aldo-keto reductase family 1 member B1-like isoform X3 [Vanessa atalanta]|uniref:aldo-keto reductase family 1 member B1-like isoform X3 n=1 Tax=Vanessa atalanta TaxID=42275 RepID=UPI001FCDB932|nr:aldo-keto reductase family 1 member B1-like isoform X3 [Vanessa atalanta]